MILRPGWFRENIIPSTWTSENLLFVDLTSRFHHPFSMIAYDIDYRALWATIGIASSIVQTTTSRHEKFSNLFSQQSFLPKEEKTEGMSKAQAWWKPGKLSNSLPFFCSPPLTISNHDSFDPTSNYKTHQKQWSIPMPQCFLVPSLFQLVESLLTLNYTACQHQAKISKNEGLPM